MLNRLKPKSEFSRNVLTLMTGTTIAQAIPIAISPILTRIYTPEDFGVFALFLAITSIFGSIANGRYELAIMLPKKDEDAINIFALGFIITSVLSLFLLIVVVIFHDYFISVLNNKDIGVWLYFVPITVFFIGIFNILNYFNNRKKQYKDLAKANVIKSIVLAIVQLSVGFLKQGATGLISGQIVSQFFANTKLLLNIIKDKILLKNISKLKIIAVAKRYKDFPKFLVPSAFFNSIAQVGLPIILAISFSSQVIGYYFFANKITRAPLSIILNSLSQVYFQKASQLYNENKITTLLNNTFKLQFKILLILLPLLLLLGFLGPILFSYIFGEEWRIAGEYIKYFAIFIMFNMLYSPISTLADILGELKLLMFFNLSLLITQVVIIYVISKNYDFKITILIVSISGALHFLSLNIYIYKILKRRLSEKKN